MKHVIGKIQYGFNKNKLCLENLITFHDKIEVCSVDGGPAGHIVHVDFSKAFDGVPRSPPMLWSEQVVCAVDGELADELHPGPGGK